MSSVITKKELGTFYSNEEINEFKEIKDNTKRILHTYEHEIKPNHLCQAIDIDIYLEGNTSLPMKNMIDYPFRSTLNAIEYIHTIKEFGIKSILLHLVGNSYEDDPYEVLEKQVEVLSKIREVFPKGEIEITVDPFMTAFNADGTWGIKEASGKMDMVKSLEILGNIALEYSKIGIDGVITLGRLENEVEVTRKAIDLAGSDLKIKSFSHNSETSNAYMYLDDLPDQLLTGQKILVGNLTEMVLRTIIDIHEGAHVIVVKPIENLHLITLTARVISDIKFVKDFLSSEYTQEILSKKPFIKAKANKILNNLQLFSEKSSKVKIGAYSVSGTYYIHKSLDQTKNGKFSIGLVEELLKNGISAAGPLLDNIMDRNAVWYFQNK
ncbi:delta-aminolevulinic acid dehydratase [Bacillus cereus]|nr:delta-aminolevulinic acid dehydratase [Bacillus cereus]